MQALFPDLQQWLPPMGVGEENASGGNKGGLRRRRAEGHEPMGGGAATAEGICLERERDELRGRRRLSVFWFVNFKKPIEGVSSALFGRVVKL